MEWTFKSVLNHFSAPLCLASHSHRLLFPCFPLLSAAMQDVENLSGWTPSKACLLNNQAKLSFNLCNACQFCISWFVQRVSILNNCWEHVEFLRRATSGERIIGSRGDAACSPFQVTGSGFFFPKNLAGHFPRECAWLHVLSLVPFLILAVSSVQTSWYNWNFHLEPTFSFSLSS